MPSAPPPSEADVRARAERAAGLAGGQATVWWEWAPGTGGVWGAEVVVVRDGRVGSAATDRAADDGALAACAEAAVAAAAEGPEGLDALPAPAPGRAHQGYDPAVLRVQDGRAGVAKAAIAAADGTTVYEQRSFVAAAVGGHELAAVSPDALEAALAAGLSDTQAGAGEPVAPPEGELPAVLGPHAVAAVLDRLRPVFGRPGELALGTRVASACIALSDSPRFATTLPRSYDVHGVPRQPVPLIQDGVAHRLVSADTGHAIRPGHPDAEPHHLVLVGGGAASQAELMAPIARGVHLVSLERGVLIEDGSATRPVDVSDLEIDPRAVLAGAQALTARQWTIPGAGGARTVGATVCPALRTVGGVRLA